jgi:hypothetical protein
MTKDQSTSTSSLPVKVQRVVDGLRRWGWNVTVEQVEGEDFYNITGDNTKTGLFEDITVQVCMTSTRKWGMFFRGTYYDRKPQTWSDFWSLAKVNGNTTFVVGESGWGEWVVNSND